MTTHQDNATRLARIAQILAVVAVVAAAASFFIKIPAMDISTSVRNRAGINPNLDPDAGGPELFKVPSEDWLIALAPLNANHNPSVSIGGGPDGRGGPGDNGGPIDLTPPPTTTTSNGRPPIRYLGSLEDPKGFAALIDFAGRQTLLRIGQEFEEDFEITEITKDQITVSDGFDEFNFNLEPSNLQSALPTPLPNSRGNPNAFPPGGRNPQGSPNNPANQTNPRRPGAKDNDDDDDGGSPA